jgi:cysteine desulfurase family protein
MIYLDNAATSWPKPPGVAEAMVRALAEAGGNPGRSGHRLAMDAAEQVMECRENLAELFHIANPLEICFTANATEALNLALKGFLKSGDHVVCSSMEHNSVWRPLCRLQKSGISFSVARANPDGTVSAEAIARELRPQTRLIALTHASNVTGTINPIAAVGELAKQRKIAFLVDAAQTAGAQPIDVEAAQIDLLAFPGHKGLLGPTGTGGLFIRDTIALEPLREGGTGSDSASPLQPEYLPDRYESGTLNTVGIAGLKASVSYLLREGVAAIQQREWHLTQRLLVGLAGLPGVTVYGPESSQPRAAVVSFNLEGRDPVLVAAQLDREFEIACRPGLHCAFLAHQTLGTERLGTVRFSPGPFTTEQEIDLAVNAASALCRSV